MRAYQTYTGWCQASLSGNSAVMRGRERAMKPVGTRQPPRMESARQGQARRARTNYDAGRRRGAGRKTVCGSTQDVCVDEDDDGGGGAAERAGGSSGGSSRCGGDDRIGVRAASAGTLKVGTRF
ncbi:hypothetical protein OBBRIDRAFT_511047 [Obba rivulosa]|uniref:Uncharacterized protein n=1 Tax=Obba rivulosa TaxID=1052685 RepID=A0A8E2AKN8_9APHY|nr:hypothetical protein OBBRIDRAFT_511047 [Obba rivulosa]